MIKKSITISILLLLLVKAFSTTKTAPYLFRQQPGGSVTLPVAGALLFNKEANKKAYVNYHKGIPGIVYWGEKGDSAAWHFTLDKAGKYRLLFELACPGYTAGGTAKITIDKISFDYIIPQTAAWEDFQFFLENTSLNLAQGTHSITITGAFFKSALMNLRDVVLIPADDDGKRIIDRKKAFNKKRSEAAVFFEQGETARKENNDFEKAIKLYKKAAAIDKTYGPAQVNTVWTYYKKMNNYEEAVKHYAAAKKAQPYDPMIYVYGAEVYRKLKKYDEAVKEYDMAILRFLQYRRQVPWWVYRDAAVLYKDKLEPKQPEKALDYFSRLYEGDYGKIKDDALIRLVNINREFSFTDDYLFYANLYLETGQKSREKGIQAYRLGEYYEKKYDYAKSSAIYARAMDFFTASLKEEKEKLHGDIYYRRGETGHKLGRLAESNSDYAKAWSLNPEKEYYKNRLYASTQHYGLISLINKESDRALGLFQKMLKLKPDRDNWIQPLITFAKMQKKYASVKPDYVHKVAAVYVKNLDAEGVLLEGGTKRFTGSIDFEKAKRSELRHELLARTVEVLTRGRVTMSFEKHFINGTVRNATEFMYRTVKDKYVYEPDFRSVEGMGEFYFNQRNNYDTFLTYWPSGMPTVGMVGKNPHYIPYTWTGPDRSRITLSYGSPMEYLSWEGTWIYLHEFWHDIEYMIYIRPAHAWYEENRARTRELFPDFTGTGGEQWYIYRSQKGHVEEEMRKKNEETGFNKIGKTMSMLLRYPATATEKEYKNLRILTAGYSYEQLKEAWEIKLAGDKKQKEKEYDAALALYKKALTINPYQLASLKEIAAIYKRKKEYETAIEYSKKITALVPSDYRPYKEIGDCYKELKEYDRALAAYNDSIRRNGAYTNVWAFFGRGVVYKRLDNYPKALQDYNKAIDYAPENDYLRAVRGNHYIDMAKKEDKKKYWLLAIADHEKRLELKPGAEASYRQIALCYYSLGNIEKAIDQYTTLIRMTDFKDYYEKRGRYYLELGREKEGFADLKKAGFSYEWIEAESAARGRNFAPFEVIRSITASEGLYIEVPNGRGNANIDEVETMDGQFSFTFTTSGKTDIWMRIYTPTDKDDSLWISVNNGKWIQKNWLGAPEGWQWKRILREELPPGEHRISILRREDGVKIDRLLITNDLWYKPDE